jgi:GH15 family glucan-1,4-alpha-glucosidase
VIPIEDLAFVGDCHGAALISRRGSVAWCAPGRFDAAPLVCGLLDPARGGRIDVRPRGAFEASRAYEGATMVLRTVLVTPAGDAVAITDFMPVGRAARASTHDYVDLVAPGWLVRRIEALRGCVELEIDVELTLAYGLRPAPVAPRPRGLDFAGAGWIWTDLPLARAGAGASARVRLEAGQRRTLVIGAAASAPPAHDADVDRWLEITRAFWTEWSGYLRYAGPRRAAVERSALVLKALTYAPTGAIVAAATTSLPEWPGGPRNWDYRFCWPRDATLCLSSLSMMGYSGEARRFADFLRRTHPHTQVVYAVDGSKNIEERTLDHLAGYAGSRPVRVGNAASKQVQLDVYGEVIDGLAVQAALGAKPSRSVRQMMHHLAGIVAERWREPDQGIWESRTPPEHHVLSKVMAWVALDRVIGMCGPDAALERERAAIVELVLREGVGAHGGLTRAFGDHAADASLLLVPATGFPAPPAVMDATVRAIEAELRHGDLVLRYRPGKDHIHGPEGAFLACSFWLVDALLLTGREAEAAELFDQLVARANDVGILSEEIDPESGAFLGNVPQALSHLGVVRSAALLELARRGGASALAGTDADRARRLAGATAGPWALWATLRQTGRVGRVFSSSRSRVSGRSRSRRAARV